MLIVGCSKTIGREMIKTVEVALRKDVGENTGGRYDFVRRDLSSVDKIKEAVADIAYWVGEAAIHLFQSQCAPHVSVLPNTICLMTLIDLRPRP